MKIIKQALTIFSLLTLSYNLSSGQDALTIVRKFASLNNFEALSHRGFLRVKLNF